VTESRKKRGRVEGERQPRLSEDDIVRAAFRLARRTGLNKLTMRGLAEELGVTPMAAYYYVKNKHDLVMLAADAVLRSIDVPRQDGRSWEEQLRDLYVAIHDEVSAYPGVGSVLADLWRTSEGRRLVAATQEILLDAGFDERTTVLAHSTLHSYLYGRFSIESYFRDRQAKRAAAGEPRRSQTTVLTRTQPFLKGLHGDDYVKFALDTVIAGLKAELESSRAVPTARSRGGRAAQTAAHT
jgi:TetR/AcrR family tetracycline transcriptional repressor